MSAVVPPTTLVLAALLLLAWVEAGALRAGQAYHNRVTGEAGDLAAITGLRRGLRELDRRLPASLHQRDSVSLRRARLAIDGPTLLAARLLVAFLGAVMATLAALSFGRVGPALSLAVGAIAGMLALELWLAGRGRDRRNRIRAVWPSLLHRLELSLVAGLPLERALQALLSLEDGTKGPLTEDLRDVCLAIRSGVSPDEALHQWSGRAGLGEIELLARAAQRCQQLGLPLGPAVGHQRALARAELHNRHQAWLNGLPGRISAVAMLFFMPAILIVALLPNVIAFLRSGW
jgi:Flp pilus assembly protein TadB